LGFSGVAAFSLIMASCLVMGAILFNTLQNSIPEIEDARRDQQERWDGRRLTSIEVLSAELVPPEIIRLDQSSTFVGQIFKWTLAGLLLGSEKLLLILGEVSKAIDMWLPYRNFIPGKIIDLMDWFIDGIRWFDSPLKLLSFIPLIMIIPFLFALLESALWLVKQFFYVFKSLPFMVKWPIGKIADLSEEMRYWVGWADSSPLTRYLERFMMRLYAPNGKVDYIASKIPFGEDMVDKIRNFVLDKLPGSAVPNLKVTVKNTGSTAIDTAGVDLLVDGVCVGKHVGNGAVVPGESFTIKVHATEMPDRIKVVTSNGVSDYWFG